jgi:hypothetical protein
MIRREYGDLVDGRGAEEWTGEPRQARFSVWLKAGCRLGLCMAVCVVVISLASGKAAVGQILRSPKWNAVLQTASICLGALAIAVILQKLSAHYQLRVHLAVCFAVGLALGVIWHEAGHHLFARLSAIPVRLMSIGVGPLVWRSHVGDVRFDLHMLPIGGMVAVYPPLHFRTFRMLMFVLGGVLGNCALIAAISLLALIGAIRESEYFTFHPVIAAQYLFIAGNLYPFDTKVDGVEMESDGLLVLRLLRGPRSGLTEAGALYRDKLTPYLHCPNQQPIFSPAAPRIFYQLTREDTLQDLGTLQDYRKSLERELTGGLSNE